MLEPGNVEEVADDTVADLEQLVGLWDEDEERKANERFGPKGTSRSTKSWTPSPRVPTSRASA